jgi:hypothetical protein
MMMRRYLLLTSAAGAALMLLPSVALAQEAQDPFNGDSELEIDYRNSVQAAVSTIVDSTRDTTLVGDVAFDGAIAVDASASAVIDNKQILTGNDVTFREETSTDGQSGNVDATVWGTADNVVANPDPQDVGDTTIDIGFSAPVIETVEDFSVTGGAGNIGLNIAAGYYNMQENIAALANSTFEGSADEMDSGGWAEASLTSLQASLGNYYGPDSVQSDDSGDDTAGNDYRDRNTVGNATVNGTGNIGVNAAAGAFNLQKNALAVATATDAALATATAAVIQTADFNDTVVMNTINVVEGPNIGSDTSGNLGVNLEAGVGNTQMNSLVIAASFTTGGAGGGGGGDGCGGTGGE